MALVEPEPVFFEVSPLAKTPPAAAPATANEIHSHLCPPRPRFRELAAASGASLKNWGHIVPARVCPLTAVIRTSKDPAVRFHCMPQTLARPSARVVTISVFEPVENVPLGPSSGR